MMSQRGFEQTRTSGLGIWLLAALALLAVLATGRAADLPAFARDPNLRFVFLLQTSAEMARREPATLKTVYDLIRTGFHDRIQPGENFAIFGFNPDGVQIRFGPQVWTGQQPVDLALDVSAALQATAYDGIGGLPLALKTVHELAATGTLRHVFVLCDGLEPISTTPWDESISAAFAKHRVRLAQDRKPFLLSLLAQNQALLDQRLHTGLEVVELPPLPKPVEAPPAIAARTEAPVTIPTAAPSTKSIPTPSSPPAEVQSKSTPAIILPPAGGIRKKVEPTLAWETAPTIPAPEAPVESVVQREDKSPVKAEPKAVLIASTPTSQPVAPLVIEKKRDSSPAPVETPLKEKAAPVSTVVPAAKVVPPNNPAPSSPVGTSRTTSYLLWLSAIFVPGLGFLAYLKIRPRPMGSSLISQSYRPR